MPKSKGNERRWRVEIPTPPEDYARVAKSQREFLHEAADKIERGETPERSLERAMIAAVLREHANQIPDAAPRKRGNQTKKIPGDIALTYAFARFEGANPSTAIAQLAETYGVSDEAMKKAIKKYGGEAALLFLKSQEVTVHLKTK